MVTSQDTTARVLEVVLSHIKNRHALLAIIDDLKDVPGNKSFRDTVLRLEKQFKTKVYKGGME